MTQQTIELKIACRHDKRRRFTVEVKGTVVGKLAVHRTLTWDGDDGKPPTPETIRPWERAHGYSVTHLPTGYAVRQEIISQKAALKLARALKHLDWDFKRVRDPKVTALKPLVKNVLVELGFLAGPKVTYVHGMKPNPPADLEPLSSTATNRYTDEQRVVKISHEWLRDVLYEVHHDECAGPCQCTVEPDGYCPKGWPALSKTAEVI